jgi:hypothetical protein
MAYSPSARSETALSSDTPRRPGGCVGHCSRNIAVGKKKAVVAGKKTAVFEKNMAVFRRNTGCEEKNTASEGKKTVVFATEFMMFDQETMVSGKNTLDIVLETTGFATETTVEETPTMVSAARSGAIRKNAVVFASETAVEEKKFGCCEQKNPVFFPEYIGFCLESAVCIPPTGARVSAMGTRIAMIAVRNLGRVMAHFKTDACAIDTGPIGAKTALSTAFHPQRIRVQPVARCATAARRCCGKGEGPFGGGMQCEPEQFYFG